MAGSTWKIYLGLCLSFHQIIGPRLGQAEPLETVLVRIRLRTNEFQRHL